MINNGRNKMSLNAFAVNLREQLRHAGDFHETTADEMAADLRYLISCAEADLEDIIVKCKKRDAVL